MDEARWTIRDPAFAADDVVADFAVYPWAGHRNFAYDLTAFVRPRRIVELGTHWGTSFFAFCQAVKDFGLDTQCVAVDTWVGDNHTGAYSDEVYDTVRRIADKHFADLSIELLRMTFADARAHVADESVDILHIDGCHNYDAVSDDYHTWLPKLRPEGVVLFHDTAISTNYESAKFFQELREKHPGFAFEHSWGLGVLFPKGTRVLEALEHQGLADKLKLYEYKAELRLAQRKLADITEMAVTREGAINDQSQMINERDATIKDVERIARERAESINEQSRMIDERDATIKDLQRQLEAAEQLARERLESINEQSRMIDERDAYIANLRQQIEESSATNAQLDARLAEIRRKLAPLRAIRDAATFPLRMFGRADSGKAGEAPPSDDRSDAKEAL